MMQHNDIFLCVHAYMYMYMFEALLNNFYILNKGGEREESSDGYF